METYPTNFYNIHNLLKIRVENLDLTQKLSYFLIDKVDETSNLTIKVGEFDPQPTRNKLGRFYLGQNVITEKRKFGSIQLRDMLGKTELNATRGYVRLRPFMTLIESITGFKLLTKNHALGHSSCVSKDGEGYLICAWHGTGKTMVTLKLVKERGLNFLSDDLTIINDSGQAYCFPKDVKLSLAHTKEFKVSEKVKLKLLFGELVTHIPVVRGRLEIAHATPITKVIENSKIEKQCKICKVIMLQQAESEEIVEIDTDEVVKRLMLQNEWERIFWVARLFIPYAYCDQKFDLQKLRKKEREILQSALRDVPCYEVRFRKYAYNLARKLLTD